MEFLVLLIVCYFGIGIICFCIMWKELENDSDRFQKLPREGRILCRVLAILFWPVYIIPIFAGFIYLGLKRLYDIIVE